MWEVEDRRAACLVDRSAPRHQGGCGRRPLRAVTNMQSLSTALRAARAGQGEVCDVLSAATFEPHLPGLTKLITALSRDNAYQKALEVYDALPVVGLRPDTALTNAAICACNRGGQWRLAMRLFEGMADSGLQRDAITYSATISALAKGKQWSTALQVFGHMQAAGVEADVVSCSSLISALERGGQWRLAQQMFLEMCSAAAAAGSRQSQQLLQKMTAAHAEFDDSSGSGNLESDAFSLRPSLRVAPNRHCCNTMLTSYSHIQQRQWGQALALLAAMWEADGELAPDIVSCNAALKACAGAGHVDAAMLVFETMVGSGVAPTVATYGTLLTAAADAGDTAALQQAWAWLEASELQPDRRCFNAMSRGTSRCAQPQQQLPLPRPLPPQPLLSRTGSLSDGESIGSLPDLGSPCTTASLSAANSPVRTVVAAAAAEAAAVATANFQSFQRQGSLPAQRLSPVPEHHFRRASADQAMGSHQDVAGLLAMLQADAAAIAATGALPPELLSLSSAEIADLCSAVAALQPASAPALSYMPNSPPRPAVLPPTFTNVPPPALPAATPFWMPLAGVR